MGGAYQLGGKGCNETGQQRDAFLEIRVKFHTAAVAKGSRLTPCDGVEIG